MHGLVLGLRRGHDLLRKLLGTMAHAYNRRRNDSCGNGSIVARRVAAPASGGSLGVGEDCWIAGFLVLEVPQSRLSIGNNVFIGAPHARLRRVPDYRRRRPRVLWLRHRRQRQPQFPRIGAASEPARFQYRPPLLVESRLETDPRAPLCLDRRTFDHPEGRDDGRGCNHRRWECRDPQRRGLVGERRQSGASGSAARPARALMGRAREFSVARLPMCGRRGLETLMKGFLLTLGAVALGAARMRIHAA